MVIDDFCYEISLALPEKLQEYGIIIGLSVRAKLQMDLSKTKFDIKFINCDPSKWDS
jgi:hypothetical protein